MYYVVTYSTLLLLVFKMAIAVCTLIDLWFFLGRQISCDLRICFHIIILSKSQQVSPCFRESHTCFLNFVQIKTQMRSIHCNWLIPLLHSFQSKGSGFFSLAPALLQLMGWRHWSSGHGVCTSVLCWLHLGCTRAPLPVSVFAVCWAWALEAWLPETHLSRNELLLSPRLCCVVSSWCNHCLMISSELSAVPFYLHQPLPVC